MKPNYTSTKSDHSQCCTSIENNYILDNRRGLMFQFPLCGEEAAVGKWYISGNETQMSLTLWSKVCDVFKAPPYEMCLSVPWVTRRGPMSKFLPILCFRAWLPPYCTLCLYCCGSVCCFCICVLASVLIGLSDEMLLRAVVIAPMSKLAAFTFHFQSLEGVWPEWSYHNVAQSVI